MARFAPGLVAALLAAPGGSAHSGERSLPLAMPSGSATIVQPCSHSDFREARPTFVQRYLVDAAAYKPGGPVLFYAGNEGAVEVFVDATGFMRTVAAQLGGLLVWAEHRGYGGSLTAACGDGLGSVTSREALADFASLAAQLRATLVGNATVVAVGGSYGGMLSAWLRLRYAHIFDGALASSAPIALGAAAPSAAIYDAVSADYGCAPRVGAAFRALWASAASAAGRAKVASALRLCAPLDSQAAAEVLVGVLQQALFTFAQLLDLMT